MKGNKQDTPQLPQSVTDIVDKLAAGGEVTREDCEVLLEGTHNKRPMRDLLLDAVTNQLPPSKRHELVGVMLDQHAELHEGEGKDDHGFMMRIPGAHDLTKSLLQLEYKAFAHEPEFERDTQGQITGMKVPEIPQPILAHYSRHQGVFQGEDPNLGMAKSISFVLFNNAILSSKFEDRDLAQIGKLANEVKDADGKYTTQLKDSGLVEKAAAAAKEVGDPKYFEALDKEWATKKEAGQAKAPESEKHRASSALLSKINDAMDELTSSFQQFLAERKQGAKEFKSDVKALISDLVTAIVGMFQKKDHSYTVSKEGVQQQPEADKNMNELEDKVRSSMFKHAETALGVGEGKLNKEQKDFMDKLAGTLTRSVGDAMKEHAQSQAASQQQDGPAKQHAPDVKQEGMDNVLAQLKSALADSTKRQHGREAQTKGGFAERVNQPSTTVGGRQ